MLSFSVRAKGDIKIKTGSDMALDLPSLYLASKLAVFG
ncbi:hypothetical protein CYCME_2249 [Cycloclasticus zancles 78-ME]|uniref:Uncharacterized protein n=1 Tax=Cycloclasticus zancles 78-ME TaxID=1198232 RepID=S5T9Y9_9GAMM|nr:hypothetical protein CYCME_2249 [Cycloclasticus zancles 78-ME]